MMASNLLPRLMTVTILLDHTSGLYSANEDVTVVKNGSGPFRLKDNVKILDIYFWEKLQKRFTDNLFATKCLLSFVRCPRKARITVLA